MPQLPPISFDAPFTLALAALICAAAGAIALLRRIHLPRWTMTMLAAGLACLCLAAGGVKWRLSSPPRVAVMVDVSASTRTARYHDPDVLAQRIAGLLGDTPYDLYAFAEQSWQTELSQLPAEADGRRTILDIPPVDAAVIFTDARFDPPAIAPPTFVVVDPALEDAADGAITRLDAVDDVLSIDVRNNDGAVRRDIVLAGATPTTLPAPPGETVVRATLEPGALHATARIVRSDPWPENDSMLIMLPPRQSAQRWWVTRDTSTSPADWRGMTPEQLPTEGMSYLGVAVIALDNIAADDLSRLQLERIEQYVRDLGGGLVILGGDRAFAAGGYAGTPLERLSPLACNPPRPVNHWVLLIDSSGSMAAAIGDNTRWHFAANAMVSLVVSLPPKDTVSLGDFADEVRWWTQNATREQLDTYDLLPGNVHPTGPTNLAPALRHLAESSDDASPTQAIIITDGEAKIDDAGALADALSRRRVRVSVLSTQPLAADSPLATIVGRTGGAELAQGDPREWTASLRELLRSSAPRWIGTSTLAVTFTPDGPPLPPQEVSPWNRTWLKPNATELATGRDANNARVPAIAAWNMRSGAVLAAAFRPDAELIPTLAEIVATPPRDPRFSVTWETGPQLRVTLDAIDGAKVMNDLRPHLLLSSERTSFTINQPLAQVAPGRYALTLPSPRRAMLATLVLDGKPLDRISLAERYPAEFNAIGNDRAAMRRLARESGGAVLEPSHTTPIDLPRRPRRSIPLASLLAAAGAALIAAGIIRWKLG